MKRNKKRNVNLLCVTAVSAAVTAVLSGLPFSASAYDIDTGNPDIALTWNNTIRYNWAQRMQSIDPHVSLAGPAANLTIAGGAANYNGYEAGDNLFKKGDTITNRLDLLTELNFVYQRKYGFRVSAAAWYDNAYAGKKPTVDPTKAGLDGTPYRNNEFTDYVKRYYHGPSGEWLDAYVFGNFDLSGSDLNVRLGRHAVVWGEGLFGSSHSIAFSQSPSDSRKQISSPGASGKELALPVNQISATAVINPEITLLAHYQFEWVPNRIPEGATYFAPGDVVLWGPNLNHAPEFKRGEKGGYGLGLKWSPEWLDGGTLGFYYRKFDDKNGWINQASNYPATNITAVWARDIELYGLSLTKNIAGVSVAAEVSYRKNDALTSSTTRTSNSTAAFGGSVDGKYEGAIGNTWHGVLNGVQQFGSSPLFDTATLIGEIAWAKLDKLTKNPGLYRAPGDLSGICTKTATNYPNIRGCVTDDFVSAGAAFTANWFQVYPSVDLAMPLFFSKNFGNSPSFGGGSEGFVTYKVGLNATVRATHIFDLSYTWFDQKIDRGSPLSGPGSSYYGRLLGAPYADKGFLAFTYQTTF